MLYLLAVRHRSNQIVSIFVLSIFLAASAGAGTIVLGAMPVGGIPDPNRFICLAWGAVIGAIVFVLPLSGGLDALRQATLLVGCRSQLIMIFMCYALYKGFRADFREPLDRQEGEIAAEQSAGQTTPNLGKYPNRSHL